MSAKETFEAYHKALNSGDIKEALRLANILTKDDSWPIPQFVPHDRETGNSRRLGSRNPDMPDWEDAILARDERNNMDL